MKSRTSTVLMVLAMLLTGHARGQACYAENDGNAYLQGGSVAGVPYAIRFTAPSSMTVGRIEVFTGNASAANSLAIWTNNPVTNLPGSSVGSGTWSVTAAPAWQGATLAPPTTLSAGSTYWIVWFHANFQLASWEPAGPATVVQPFCVSFNGLASWSPLGTAAWKFRLYCGGGGWQSNQPCASMDINGVQTSGFGPATSTTLAGQPVPVHLAGQSGALWDIAYTVNTPLASAALVTPGGQFGNLNQTQLAVVFGAAFSTPFVPSTLIATFGVPNTQIAAQMFVITPTVADGFCLSQAVELQVN